MLRDSANEGLLESKDDTIRDTRGEGKVDEATSPKLRHKKTKRRQRSEITYFLKTINLIVGLAYIGFSVFFYIRNEQKDESQNRGLVLRWVMPGYIGLSGLIIVLIECRIGLMVRNLRFFYNYFGRGVFNLYAAGMPLMLITNWENDLEMNDIIAISASGVMALVGIFYIVIKCCCCEKEGDQLDRDDEEDENDEN